MSRPNETEKERIDRELLELLQELRVALPGVQVLFAFLLILPFNEGFDQLADLERAVYLVSLLCAAGSTALLIAPTSYHRLRFRSGDKKAILFSSTKMAVAGLALLAAAICAAVYVVVSVILDQPWVGLVVAATAAWFAWFWYGLPLSRNHRDA